MRHASTIMLMALSILTGLASCATPGSPLLRGKPPADASDLQKDFLQLAAYVARNHAGLGPGPRPIMTMEQYGKLVEEVYARMAHPASRDEWYIELSRFVARLEDGHTQIPWKPSRCAPFAAWWSGDRLYAIAVTDPSYGDVLYKEIVGIGGMTVPEPEGRINEYISADAGQLLYKRQKSPDLMLSEAYLSHFGLLDSSGMVVIEYLDGSARKSVRVSCAYPCPESASLADASLRDAFTKDLGGNWFDCLPGCSAVYVQLNSLSGEPDLAFYERLFRLAKERGARNLVLDLRNNGGGNSQWCDVFLTYIDPDVAVYPTLADFQARRDPVMDKVRELIAARQP